MAGWDVTVMIPPGDARPCRSWGPRLATSIQLRRDERPHPQTVAVAADLFVSDERVREGVLGALDHGMTEVTLWGERSPPNWTAPSIRCNTG